jgi:hypothetical protein
VYGLAEVNGGVEHRGASLGFGGSTMRAGGCGLHRMRGLSPTLRRPAHRDQVRRRSRLDPWSPGCRTSPTWRNW